MAISDVQLPVGVNAHEFNSPVLLAEGLALNVAKLLSEAIAARGNAVLVVSGGRSPVAFFQHLAKQDLDWSKVVVTLADERWVPVEHADSNAGLLKQYLLKGPAAKAQFLSLYSAAANVEQAAEQADRLLAELPPIDVLVLGMGDDGHTASLFPGSPNLAEALAGRWHSPLLADAGTQRAASAPDHEPCAAGFGQTQDSVDFRSVEADHPECRTGIRRRRRHAGARVSATYVRDLLVPMSQGTAAMTTPSPTVSMADKVALIDSLCAKARILPVITIAREQDVLPLADALAAGGLTALEVTLRSQFGLKAIQILRDQRPELMTGAGTVLDRNMLAAAEAAGSQFIVTPGITRDLLEASVASPIPLLPGISNASGIMEGYGLGYRRFKLFPAEVSGGVAAIKALGGPFGEVKFCPTGGVGPANIKSYMALKNVMCVGGSWMLDPEWIKNGDWARIQECTAEALALLD
jgi:2-dehydro-3-deoxyphosphogluconate aldolase/(4S)-4-hydroxy-2-oxoglutarate aldolase